MNFKKPQIELKPKIIKANKAKRLRQRRFSSV